MAQLGDTIVNGDLNISGDVRWGGGNLSYDYSYKGHIVGKWVDGRDLYRICYHLPRQPSDLEIKIDIISLNAVRAWVDSSTSYFTHNTAVLPVNMYHSSTDWIRAFIGRDITKTPTERNIILQFGTTYQNNYSGYLIVNIYYVI